MIKRLRGCLLALAVVLIASPALAQGLQTGSLQGTAQDAAGLVLPGVTVTVTSPSLQGVRTTVTDANGIYVLRALPRAVTPSPLNCKDSRPSPRRRRSNWDATPPSTPPWRQQVSLKRSP